MNVEAEGDDDASANRSSSSVYHWNGVDQVPRGVTHVIVDSSVTVIRQEAFYEHKNLRKVELPEGVLKIEPYAFSYCIYLADVNIPHSVTEIGDAAFMFCEKLERLILPGRLLILGASAFNYCKSLKRLNIPPGIKTIESDTFWCCSSLEELDFSEGLEGIRSRAFYYCLSLVSVNLPQSLRVIGDQAFALCKRLNPIDLPDAVESIGEKAFADCSLQSFRVPPQIVGLHLNIFCGDGLVSLELPDNNNSIHGVVPRPMVSMLTLDSLRNMASPMECNFDLDMMNACPSFQIAFPGEDTTVVVNALKTRFDDLPIHKICYYQSYHDTQIATSNIRREINPWNSKFPGRLNATGKEPDCLGMSPLHILACSTKQYLEMFQLLVEKYPETLIMKDKWGDVPLLYALWCNAPEEILGFLVESYKSIYPDYVSNWAGMIRTFALGKVPLDYIRRLVSTQKNHFPSQHYDMKEVIMELARYDQRRGFFDRHCTPFDTFRYLVEASISERLVSLNVTRWQVEIDDMIGEITINASHREEITAQLYEKLASYEQLKESAALLELALWKAKIDESKHQFKVHTQKKQRVEEQANRRADCHLKCGAEIILRNVYGLYLSHVGIKVCV